MPPTKAQPRHKVSPAKRQRAEQRRTRVASPAGIRGRNVRATKDQGKKRRPFPIVGIGASAGGLEAFTQLLKHQPPDSGMAFILIQHLDPSHRSLLPEILSKATAMMVTQVTNGAVVRPNRVYVMPPN